jgi:O-antigen/teichoic acid export membrane protein
MIGNEIKCKFLSLYQNFLSASLYKNFVFLVTNSFLTSILGFVFIIIITKLVPESDIGIYAAILSVVGLLALLSRLGLDVSLISFLPQSKDQNSLINSCFIIGIFTSILMSIIFILGANNWAPSLSYALFQPLFLFSFIGAVIATVLIGFQMNIFISKRSTKFLIIRDIIFNILKIILVLILAFFLWEISAIDLVYITTISLIISLFLGFVLLKIVIHNYSAFFTIDFLQIKMMTKFSLGNYLSSIIGTGAQLALPLLVFNMLGAANTAFFYIAWTLRNFIEVIPGAICTSLFAEGVNCPKDLYSNAKKSFIISYAIIIPLIIAIVIFGSFFLSIFGDIYAQNCYPLLILFAVSVLFSSANQIFYNIKLVNKDIGFILFFTSFSGFGLLVFSAIFMSIFGLIGVGIGLVISQAFLLILILVILLIRHYMPVR